MIGKTIRHYKILEELGRGGMGTVYKAQDTKLKRNVALKFLTPQALSSEEEKTRFVHEAQAAAALDHPNICTVYEIDEAEGQTFIAMAYVEGQSLKEKIESGPLKLEEALDIAIQVAQGLARAHEAGITHRDIKPANIIITARDEVKIVDFGLAKLAGQVKLTKTGTTMGTVAYMSPEQARGEEVDHRTDIWSFGVILYEMLTGQLPFQGEYEQAVIYSILNEDAKPITNLRSDVPLELEQVLKQKTLQKDSCERYQHMDALIAELESIKKKLKARRVEVAGEKEKPYLSIAVLPFVDMSPQKDQEYFCDGMAEELINAFTKIKELRVVARTSAFSFKGKEIDVREIGKRLNVETLLEGSIRKAGNRLRITAELINVTDGYHLWSEKYDRDMEDIFAIQDEISLAIVDSLKLKLLKEEEARLIKRHTDDPEAYNFYLKGRYFWNKRTEEGLKRSVENFQKAIKKDPEFALAYAGLADSISTQGFYDFILPRRDAYARARAEALKALELDDTVGETHAAMANIKAWCDWDWVGAEQEYKTALELNLSDVEAHHMYAHLLEGMGRFTEALVEMNQALEFEPLSINLNTCFGHILCLARRYDEAIEQLQKTIEMDPSFSLQYFWLGRAYLGKGMHEQAMKTFEKAGTFPEIRTMALGALGYANAVGGRRDEAQDTLDQMKNLSEKKYIDPFYIAWIYIGLGKKELAIEMLEKAYEERSMYMVCLKEDTLFDDLRSEPRFIELLKKMGLDK